MSGTAETGRVLDVDLSEIAAMRIPPTILENGTDLIPVPHKHRSPSNEVRIFVGDHAGSREMDRDHPSRIDSALKSWLDSVIVPSLVRRYLSEREESKRTGVNQGTKT